jgi:TetR/AcrR family transcriptional repressor of nem operon
MKPESETKGKLLRVGMQLIWENSYGSVSVDDICKRADVKKGSFYHFFPSKSDLAVAAMEADWQRKRVYLDQYFSPQTPALDRIDQFFMGALKAQQEKSQECGKVCGCPTMTFAAELSTQDENIRRKTVEIMDRYVRYLESAIVDAIREGVVKSDDPRALALGLYAYFQGLLLQAKVRNDLAPLHIARSGMLSLLRCEPTAAIA